MRARQYLSHSQKVLWKKSRKDYIAKYIHDKPQFTTKEMAFGTLMANALENDELTGNVMLDVAMAKIPKFEVMDVEHRVDMKIGKKIIPLLARMDSRKADFSAFKEYKTGKGAWTQKKVDDDPQITFYATFCSIMTGKIPEDIELVWVVTENDSDDWRSIVATGEVKIFKTTRSREQIIKEKADMKKVWDEIGIMCEEEML